MAAGFDLFDDHFRQVIFSGIFGLVGRRLQRLINIPRGLCLFGVFCCAVTGIVL